MPIFKAKKIWKNWILDETKFLRPVCYACDATFIDAAKVARQHKKPKSLRGGLNVSFFRNGSNSKFRRLVGAGASLASESREQLKLMNQMLRLASSFMSRRFGVTLELAAE